MAQRGLRRSRGLGQCVSRVRPGAFPSRRHQLAQNLGRGELIAAFQLGHRRGERPPERRRKHEAGDPLAQSEDSTPVGPFGQRRIGKQVLSDPHNEPEGEHAVPPGSSGGLGEQRQQWCSPAHVSARHSVVYTASGWISCMHR
jgi:hypothetical protein